MGSAMCAQPPRKEHLEIRCGICYVCTTPEKGIPGDQVWDLLCVLDPRERNTWRSGVGSAMCARPRRKELLEIRCGICYVCSTPEKGTPGDQVWDLLCVLNPGERNTWRSGVGSAMCARPPRKEHLEIRCGICYVCSKLASYLERGPLM